MTKVKEGHHLVGKLENIRVICPEHLNRGRVVKYFSEESPDTKGKYGYGFLQTESGDEQFFHISKLHGVEMSVGLPTPTLLRVPRHHLEPPLREPKVGDILRYGLRAQPCGYMQEACPWMYERDYEAAKQELASR